MLETLSLMGAGFINAFSPINLLAMVASTLWGSRSDVFRGIDFKDDKQLGELIKAQDVFAREVISKLY